MTDKEFGIDFGDTSNYAHIHPIHARIYDPKKEQECPFCHESKASKEDRTHPDALIRQYGNDIVQKSRSEKQLFTLGRIGEYIVSSYISPVYIDLDHNYLILQDIEEGSFGRRIHYCPICGRKLDDEQTS